MKFRVRLAQINPALGDLQRNLELHHQAIDAAVAEGVDLLVFPELSLTGYYLRDLVPEVALRRESPQLADLVKRSVEISLAFGLVEETPDFKFHIAGAYCEGGLLKHVHRKVYLPTYGMFDEERYFAAGDRVRCFDTRFGRMGLLICEDFWHPSAVYLASLDGMHHLLAIANSPSRGGAEPERPHTAVLYERMLATYAELFQVYVFFVNRVGYEEGVNFWGGSALISPEGERVAEGPYLEEAVVTGEADLQTVRRCRARAPLLSDEKIDLTIRELERIYSERLES